MAFHAILLQYIKQIGIKMPSTDLERIKRIEAYLDDQLSSEERDAFETEMFEDEALLKDVMLLQKIDGTLHDHAEIIFEEFSQPEKASLKRSLIEAFFSFLSAPIKMNMTWLTWGRLSIAAAVVLIVLMMPKFLSQSGRLQELAELTPQQAGFFERSIRSDIIAAYGNGDYERTIRLVDQTIEKSSTTALPQDELFQLYRLKGLAQYFDRNYAAALESFNMAKAQSKESAATEELWWLISQAQLKLENKEGAIIAARNVIEYEDVYEKKARALLAKLEAKE